MNSLGLLRDSEAGLEDSEEIDSICIEGSWMRIIGVESVVVCTVCLSLVDALTSSTTPYGESERKSQPKHEICKFSGRNEPESER